MNTLPPGASSTANHNQPGEKRKRESEQPQPQPQPPNPEGNATFTTRQRIVEILSNTANGCLSELGYFPGMPMRLKELEAQNLKWRDENVKLFEDNQRLLNTVKALNTSISLSNLSEPAQLQRVMELDSEIRRLQTENENIRKLVQVPEVLQNEYARLQESHDILRQSYYTLREENHRLSKQLYAFVHAQTGQQVPQNDPGRQVQSTPAPYNVQRPGMALPYIQTQSVAQSQDQRRFSSSPITAPHPQYLQMVNNQEHRDQLPQTQNAVFHDRQQLHSNPSSRRSSLNLVSPSVHQYQQAPSQTNDSALQFSSGLQIHSPNEQQHFNIGSSGRIIPVGTNLQQNLRRSSVPIVYHNGNPYPYFLDVHPNPSRASYDNVEPPPSSAITTFSNQSRRTETPPTPLSASRILAQQSHFVAPASSDPSTSTSHHVEHNVQAMATTISPQDTYIHPPDVPQAQPNSSAVISPQLVGATAHQQNAPVQDAEQFSTTSFLGPLSSSLPPTAAATSSVSQSSNPSSSQLIPQVNSPTDVQGQFTASSSSVSDDQAQTAMQVDAPEDDQEIEESDIGPDGLRLVKVCLEDLFGEPVDGRLICKLCEHRYRENIQEKGRAYFVDATDEELVAHAIAEHNHAWEHLRQPEAEESEDI